MLQKQLVSRVICLIVLLLSSRAFGAGNYLTIVESQTPETLIRLESAAKASKIDKKSMGKIMQWTALQLLGKPYSAALLDRTTPEYLYISLNETDCMLFIEEVLGVSKMIKHDNSSMDSLTANIKDIRYHGELSYCNRNHYFKDWALSNIQRGLLVDKAAKLSGRYLEYPAEVMGQKLASSPVHANDLMCIRSRESYINSEKLGFIPLSELPKYLSKIKSGDIIGIVRTPNGHADSIHHLGIAYIHDGKVGMIDASSIYHKVVVEDTLTGYLSKFNNSLGIILLRAK